MGDGTRQRGVMRRAGRRLALLFDPDRVTDLSGQIREVNALVSKVADDVSRVARRVDALDKSWSQDFRKTIATLDQATRRQSAVANRLLKQSRNRGEREATRERVFQRLNAIARRDGPVLVGPWTGEVGFELLYWAPFVRWAMRKFRIAPERVTILSRGGTASWYGIDDARYADVFEFGTTDEFRERTAEQKKQRLLSTYDRVMLRRARAGLGGSRYSFLHPALMYSLFMPYWKLQESVTWVTDHTDFRRVTAPVIPELARRLPRDYVATRFYFSYCFPDTPANRAIVSGLIQSLSADLPVVLLGPGMKFDDHHDFSAEASSRVLSVEDLMTPQNNLAVQTAVIAGARAFLGTYGGFSYLAPLCGVNTVALYSVRNYMAHHLEMARMVFDEVGAEPFTSTDVAALPLLRHLAAGTLQEHR